MFRARFDLSELDVYDLPEDVDYTTLFELAGLPVPELRDTPWAPISPPLIHDIPHAPAAIFSAMQAGDILVHHPYENFDASVEHFISAAADDPQTVLIKMTAYRIGDDTPFVESLIRAAERGKQVACVMEIKARFDEERNLHWAAELERVGAHVSFRSCGTQNTRQDGTGRQEGIGRAAQLRPYRHRQLPRENSAALCGLWLVNLRPVDYARCGEPLPLPDGSLKSTELFLTAGGAEHDANQDPRADQPRKRKQGCWAAGTHHRQNESIGGS